VEEDKGSIDLVTLQHSICGGETTADLLHEGILWVLYLGCNHQQGDKTENNDCSVKRKSGSIQIEETRQDRCDGTWPVSVRYISLMRQPRH
jgi:hypothetical protein